MVNDGSMFIWDNIWLWSVTSLALYSLTSWYIRRIEFAYRTAFHAPLPPRSQEWLSFLTTLACVSGLAYLSRDRLVASALPSWALCAAALRGVWRIDRICLLIPDRLQILGVVSGFLFLMVQVLSGESLKELLLQLSFAWGVVLLLWLLSAAYFKLRGVVGIGMGDIKLLAWLSLLVQTRIVDVIFIAIIIGVSQLILTSIVKSFQKKSLTLPLGTQAFAFGPAIVLAVVLREWAHYA